MGASEPVTRYAVYELPSKAEVPGPKVAFLRVPATILLTAAGDGRDQAAIEVAHGLALRSGTRLTVAAVLSSPQETFSAYGWRLIQWSSGKRLFGSTPCISMRSLPAKP